AAGQVVPAEQLLASIPGDASSAAFADALRTVVISVTQPGARNQHATRNTQHASPLLADSYLAQSRADLPEALRLARAAAERSPKFGFAWARVAELEFSFGHTAEALLAIEQALQLSPRNAEALVVQGFLLAGEGRFQNAIARFDQAIGIDSALGNAWLGRGLCRLRQG